MANTTDAFASAVGAALFLAQPLTITGWTLHLYTTAPNAAGTNGVEVPAGANGYAPLPFDPGAARWAQDAAKDANGNTVFRNLVPVQFPAAVASWGIVVAVGLKDQTGQLCFVNPLVANKTVAAGDAPVFLAGELVFGIG